jgi:hypothetical protein
MLSVPLVYRRLWRRGSFSTACERTAYGFRDEEYLAMKIITHFLPPLPDHAKITHTILR